MAVALIATAIVALAVSVALVGSGHSRAPVTSLPNRSSAWWRPGPAAIEWQWELGHPLQIGDAGDMRLGARTASGEPAAPPTVYDIDGFENPASTVAALHARGARVICYIEVGAAETYRTDYSAFPKSDLGRVVDGYPQERYLNVEDPRVIALIEARIDMCHQKKFDAVEPDIDDSYTDTTGFDITEAENIRFDRILADYAHSLGVAWGQKNGDSDRLFSESMAPNSDFLLSESCFEYNTCSTVTGPYLRAGKPVLEAEYSLPLSQFCPAADAANINAELFDPGLAGPGRPCR